MYRPHGLKIGDSKKNGTLFITKHEDGYGNSYYYLQEIRYDTQYEIGKFETLTEARVSLKERE